MTASSLRRFPSVAAGLLCFSLTCCKSTKKPGDYSGVVDYTTPNTNLSQEEYPFDEKGNYLADVVSGKKKGSKNKKTETPKPYTDTYEKPPESAVAATSTPNYETPPAATSDPYAPVYSSGTSGSGSTASKPKTSSNSGSGSSSKPKSGSSSKSKPVAKAKPKPKPKPSSISYTIKKGDTLYSLANRYGTSVSAIKSANGMSGDTLRDGRSLKIPRK